MTIGRSCDDRPIPEGVLPLARAMGELADQLLQHHAAAANARAEFNAAWDAAMRERQERLWAEDATVTPSRKAA